MMRFLIQIRKCCNHAKGNSIPFLRHVAKFFLVSCMLLNYFVAVSQTNEAVQAKQNTYALVVGISKYQNTGIEALDYAHRDASFFADYLKSKAGGEVPDSNIRLLQNEKATYTAIYQALDWLLETCKAGDLVYFYFSGHGDMESSTIYKLGFLISYNTPRSNYINNAVRIEDLNNYANTLSLKTKAKVILITDACHSGNLAGSEFKGNLLVGEQLRTVQNNEIRITSCAPDQLSVEDSKWGGGRGVFSYYLLKGLNGLADEKKDGNITVKEISNYLQTSLSNDLILKQKNHKQTPIIKGNNDVEITKRIGHAQPFAEGSFGGSANANMVKLAPLAPDASQYFFELLELKKIEELFNFQALRNLPKSEIAFAMFEDSRFLNKVNIDSTQIHTLKTKLKSNPDALKRFNKKLVELISNRGQDIINLYLSGDAEEIERRRYYNSVSNDYEDYAKMFEVALKLSDQNSPLAKILEIKYNYFSGVAQRLKIPLVKEPQSLIDKALEFQNKALLIEENAAYIHNELGLLYKMNNDFTKAKKAFEKATQIAPTWAIPWSNLVSLAVLQKNFEEGLIAANKAFALQPDYQGTYVNAGSIYEQKGNLLLAEEYYRRSIEINSRHFLPFERLGFVYIGTTQYNLADSFFHEAEIRKQGFNITPYMDVESNGVADGFVAPMPIDCKIPEKIADKDAMTYLVKARIHLIERDTQKAEQAFKKVIEIDKKNPLAFHYLGKIMWQQKRWSEADLFFSYAIQYYLAPNEFALHCDSIKKFITNQDECIDKEYRKAYYIKFEDYFLLADAYENWNHFGEAELLYEKLIQIDSSNTAPYYKLWNLLERLGRYDDAENVLQWHHRNCDGGLEQLNAFYERVTNAFPNSGEWHYRAGSFHCREASRHAEKYAYDVFKNEPDKGVNDYNRDDLSQITDLAFLEKSLPLIWGTREAIRLGVSIPYPKRMSIVYLQKADSLLTDINLLADANAKIGDMYIALHGTAYAYPYYQKASYLQGNNAGIRLKLIDSWHDNFRFQDAKKQLDTLLMRNEINYKNLLLLARYKTHASEFMGIDTILRQAQKIHPYKLPEIEDLFGRYHYRAKQFAEAIPFYEKYLQAIPKSTMAMYTLAKIYYQQGKEKECYEWLKKAIDHGFNNYWVLKYDPLWEKERGTIAWQKLTVSVTQRPLTDTQNERTQIAPRHIVK